MESPPLFRVVIADPLAPEGLGLLREAGCEVVDARAEDGAGLRAALAGADALMVRSRTRVDADLLAAGERLRVVARAGIGVDNIDLDAASGRGILVVNVPAANLLSATEHTFALLLALARNVASAHRALADGEWGRSRFVGTELHGKTLGIVGLGRIGREVAKRARAFGMAIVAYDPYLDRAVAERQGIELLDLGALLERVDAVTLHLPLTSETRGLLGAAELSRVKPGALLVNCARGGIVDEEALLAALESGRLGGAALDVFAEEPPTDRRLVEHPRVVATPHLGAQTREAQERASVEAARTVLDALGGSLAVSAVNLPFSWHGGWDSSYLVLAEQLGRLAAALVGGAVRRIEVDIEGIGDSLERPVALAAARGALLDALGPSVGFVNVEAIAAERGIEIVRSRRSGARTAGKPGGVGYGNLISVTAVDNDRSFALAGTLFDGLLPRVVRFGGVPLEFTPEGSLLVVRSYDRPGVVGRVGSLLGAGGVNIADVHLARKDGEEDAWTVFRLDQGPDEALLAELAMVPNVRTARRVDLGRPWGGDGRRRTAPSRFPGTEHLVV